MAIKVVSSDLQADEAVDVNAQTFTFDGDAGGNVFVGDPLDLEVEKNTGLILTSPDGTRWRVTVDDTTGALGTSEIV